MDFWSTYSNTIRPPTTPSVWRSPQLMTLQRHRDHQNAAPSISFAPRLAVNDNTRVAVCETDLSDDHRVMAGRVEGLHDGIGGVLGNDQR